LDEESFLSAIRESAPPPEVIREAAKENAETLVKSGNLTSEKVWAKWKARLENQLSMLYCVNCVRLVNVISENEDPEEGNYADFTQECIEPCKLTGQEFAEDLKHVHNIIQSLFVGEDAEQN
jgi:hypothetical protein